jgi:hypothetical protein
MGADGAATNPLDNHDVFKITPTVIGVSAGSVTVGPCSLTLALTIDQVGTQPGYGYLMVSRQVKGAGEFLDDGFGLFSVLDSLAGPTPSAPEVDVEWKVLSQHACSDNFGNHVAKVYYCVQVTIGNNSAHSLQLAGIGFKSPSPLAGMAGVPSDAVLIQPNSSYQSARAVAQNGQSTSFRNILYNGVQGVGLIMSAFTPYFSNPINKSKWSTGSSIVSGVFLQAIGLVAPDLTIRELNNLDDQSLRDGKLISNNTQASPVMVFVDKKDVTDALAELQTQVGGIKTRTIGQETLLKDLNTCLKKSDCGPLPVKLALGSIVIVGDQVDFYQRIVVDSSVTSQEVPTPPAIANNQVSATSNATSPTTTTISLSGTNLDKISGVLPDNAAPAGVLTGSIVLSGTTSLSVPVTVPAGFHGQFKLNFSSPSGSIPVTVTVP